MASMTLRSVPFANWDEWILVRNGIYANNFVQKSEALKIISIWRARGSLPHSIDLTGQIVEVQNQDPQYSQEAKDKHSFINRNSQAENLRLLYSIVIVRSVNGIVEPNQQSYFAQSISVIAERLGLPGWIVELRHDATHKQLPSLSVLRAAGEYLLNWYQQNYWDPQLNLLQTLNQSCLPLKYIQNKDNAKNTSSNTNYTPQEENDMWIQTLSKNMNSSSFLIDIFLPFFTSAVIKVPLSSWYYSEEKEISYCFQKLTNSQLSTWNPVLQSISYMKESWIDACLCRFILMFVEFMEYFLCLKEKNAALEKPSTAVVEKGFQMKLVLFWFVQLMKLENQQPSFPFQASSSPSIQSPQSNNQQQQPKKKKRRSLQRAASNNSLSSLNSGDVNASGMVNVPPMKVLLAWKRKEFLSSMKYQILSLSSLPASQSQKSYYETEMKLLLELIDCSLVRNTSEPKEVEEEKKILFQNVRNHIQGGKADQETDLLITDEKEMDLSDENDKNEGRDDSDEGKLGMSPSSEKKRTTSSEEVLENDKKKVKISESIESTQATQSDRKNDDYLTYLQQSSSSSLGVFRCHNFPLWPLGLMPGKYDCNHLLRIEEEVVDQ
jgi:hypothetical protein